jgi:hypothetical protein
VLPPHMQQQPDANPTSLTPPPSSPPGSAILLPSTVVGIASRASSGASSSSQQPSFVPPLLAPSSAQPASSAPSYPISPPQPMSLQEVMMASLGRQPTGPASMSVPSVAGTSSQPPQQKPLSHGAFKKPVGPTAARKSKASSLPHSFRLLTYVFVQGSSLNSHSVPRLTPEAAAAVVAGVSLAAPAGPDSLLLPPGTSGPPASVQVDAAVSFAALQVPVPTMDANGWATFAAAATTSPVFVTGVPTTEASPAAAVSIEPAPAQAAAPPPVSQVDTAPAAAMASPPPFVSADPTGPSATPVPKKPSLRTPLGEEEDDD